MKKHYWVVAAASILTVAAISFYFCMPRVVEVETSVIEYCSVSQSVVGYGTVKEKKRSGYYMDLPAKVSRIYVESGQQVAAGQPLVEFDRQATELYLKMAAAGLIRYDPQTDEMTVGNREFTLDASTLQTMLEQLEQMPTVLYANYDCIITAVNAQEGEFTTPYQPVVVMSDMSGYQAVIAMEESELEKIGVGSLARISGNAFEGSYTAQVTEIAARGTAVAVAGSAESMFDVTLSIDGGAGVLKPNQSARCEIIVATDNNAIRLPYEAVFLHNGHDCVYVEENGYAVLKYITVERTDELGVIVTGGVTVGERIVNDHTQIPYDGCRITSR